MMKTYVPVLVLLLLFQTCSGESEIDSINPISPNLEGQWILFEAQCFCAFSDNFNFASHRISFDTENNRITVVNDPENFFIIREGTYVVSASDDILIINGELEYRYSIRNNQLRLVLVDDPNISDDEITLIYSKDNGIFNSP